MKTFISLLCLFIVIGCTFVPARHQGMTYAEFPETRNLLARTLPLDTAIFSFPFRIRMHKDTVAIMDLHGADHFIHLFHYPDFTYMTSLGRRGESPEELLSVENIRWSGGLLWALDSNGSKLVKFSSLLPSDSVFHHETVSLDKEVLRALDFVVYDDSTFIIPDYSGDSRFCWVDSNGRLLRKIGSIPTGNKEALDYARPALAQAWRSFIDYNPRNGILAAVTQLGEVLEIYNLKDSTHVVCIGPHGEPEFKIAEGYGVPNGIMGYSDVQVTDSVIYAVFHGNTFEDISRKMQKGDMTDGGKYIYVFSLTGEPLRKYVLDHYVYGIMVDEYKKNIISIDVNSDEPIVEYDLDFKSYIK